jgi:hypothetical protein
MKEFFGVIILFSLLIGTIKYIRNVTIENRKKMMEEVEEIEETND